MPDTVNNSGNSWKLGLALLVGVFLIGMAATLFTAARRVSRVVDTDYYSQGLHYGDTQDSSKNAGIGWTLTAELAGPQLQVRVSDRSGAPVGGGILKFEPQPRSDGQAPHTFDLAESAPGTFRALHPITAPGELHGTLRFTRGKALASRKLVLFN